MKSPSTAARSRCPRARRARGVARGRRSTCRPSAGTTALALRLLPHLPGAADRRPGRRRPAPPRRRRHVVRTDDPVAPTPRGRRWSCSSPNCPTRALELPAERSELVRAVRRWGSTRRASPASRARARARRLAPVREARPRPVHRLRPVRAHVRRGPGHVRPRRWRAAASDTVVAPGTGGHWIDSRLRRLRRLRRHLPDRGARRSRVCSTPRPIERDDARRPAATAASAAPSTSHSATTRSRR